MEDKLAAEQPHNVGHKKQDLGSLSFNALCTSDLTTLKTSLNGYGLSFRFFLVYYFDQHHEINQAIFNLNSCKRQ